MTKNQKYYIFLDEIQSVTNWEKSVNSFKAKYNNDISIFITGSNGDLLSGELSSLISGRYVSFKVFPFSFLDVCKLNNDLNKEDLFKDYILWGGLPQRFNFNSDSEKRVYLSDIYDSIVLKDIIKRYKIKDIDLLNRLVEYIMNTPSQIFSVESVIGYFSGNNREVSKETIYNYLDYMCRAFLINKAERYDVRGKRILIGKYKYYLTDLGLGRVKNISKKEQIGAYLENIVYNELLVRGYDVNIGNLEQGEIDFIATRYEEKIYIQVTYMLYDDSIINREFGAYDKINDNYPKFVLSMDKFNFSQNGIIHKNVIEWLLDK